MRGAFFLVVGVIVLGVAIAVAIDKREFVRRAVAADGRVVALNAGGAHPNVEFLDREGRAYTFPEGGWISGYRPGQRVRVLYLRNDPEGSARLDDWGAIWAAPLFLGSLGVAHAAGGLNILCRRKRRVRLSSFGRMDPPNEA